MNQSQFLSRSGVSVIMRVFATKHGAVPGRVAMVSEAVDQVLSTKVNGKQLVKRVDVLVWADSRYNSDCGLTKEALWKRYGNTKGVHVTEIKKGDLFCAALNHGIALGLRGGADYSIIMSPDARSYFTEEVATAFVEAACVGALGIGLATNELTESILAGRLANTMAMWHNMSLITAGGFDLRAAKPTDDQSATYLRGWDQHHNKVVFYHQAGVEEVIPCARLVEAHGPCLAPILPKGDGAYQVPDPTIDLEAFANHYKKLGTKLERQTALLAMVGFDPSFLKGGVIPEYRRF